jgi:hypothetical protein
MAVKAAEKKLEKWNTDAGNISNYHDFDKIVYRNGIIDEFLNGNSKYFIIAGKGMGKTLLLSYKRYLLEEKYSDAPDHSIVTFVPKKKPYVDFIQSITTTLSNAQHNRLKSWEYCKRLWMMIIELSAISFSSLDIPSFLENLPSRAERYKRTLTGLINVSRTIEYIFNEILGMSETGMIHFVDDVSNAVSEAFKSIHNRIFFFFDRIDQTLESSHGDIWVPIQVGLLEAAWDIMRSNHHIRIFLSIRQEAYAAHKSQNAHAISGEVSIIRYTDSELKELLDNLVNYYENEDKVEKFIGREYFYNTTVKRNEPVFSFMNRYSLGRPRDFVYFCDVLSSALKGKYKNDTEKGLALENTIIQASSSSIIKNIHAEVHMLLNCLKTIDDFDRFLVLLKNNILSYKEMQNICNKYNGCSCSYNCRSCSSENHPFCDLYNVGLLGKIDLDSASNQQIQKFKPPYDNMISGLRADSDFYFVHPSLRSYINELHLKTEYGDGYNLLDDLLIGDGLPWNSKLSKITKIDKLIMLLKNENAKTYFGSQRHEFSFKKTYSFSFDACSKACISCGDDERKTIDSIIELLNDGLSGLEKKISVFVSYAWEDEAHKGNVESFTDMLRAKGFDAVMDSSLKRKYPDLDKMMTIGLNCNKIIIILSENYKKKADNQEGGVWKEFKMIADELEINPQKFIFVSFEAFSDSLKRRIAPRRIGNHYIVDLCKGKSDDYNELISFLTDEDDITFKLVNTHTQMVSKKEIKPFGK